jgi:hypothetical protein
MRRIAFLLLVSLFLFVSCTDEFKLSETDVKLTDDWEETIAVYANFNAEDTIHFIRINRGFGSENFFSGNTNPDSIYFDPSEISVTLYKMRVNSIYNGIIESADTLSVFECQDTLISKESSGSFSTEKVPVFYVETEEFSENNVDDIYIGLEVITPKKKVTSFTKAVGNSYFEIPNPHYDAYRVEFHEDYIEVQPRLPQYTQIYNVEVICTYFEIMSNGERVPKSFSIGAGTKLEEFPVTTPRSGIVYRVNSDLFYEGLERDILENGDMVNTVNRTLGRVYFSCYAGNNDLALASEGSTLSTGFSAEPLGFSNINNGYGMFSFYRHFESNPYRFSEDCLTAVLERFGIKYGFVLGGDA